MKTLREFLAEGPTDKLMKEVEAGTWDKDLASLLKRATSNKNTALKSAIEQRIKKVGLNKQDSPKLNTTKLTYRQFAQKIIDAIERTPEMQDAYDSMNAAGVSYKTYEKHKKAVDTEIKAISGFSDAQKYARSKK